MKPVLPFLWASVKPEKFVWRFFALGLTDKIFPIPIFLCAIDPFCTLLISNLLKSSTVRLKTFETWQCGRKRASYPTQEGAEWVKILWMVTIGEKRAFRCRKAEAVNLLIFLVPEVGIEPTRGGSPAGFWDRPAQTVHQFKYLKSQWLR